MLTRSGIEARLPHAGAMCLIDSVQTWDEASIICAAKAPDAGHPLAKNGKVPAIAAAEYAAQAAALHGALLDGAETPRQGMLAKVADVDMPATEMDELAGALLIKLELASRTDTGCLYRFDVSNRIACVARGRFLVAFQS